MRLKDKAIKVAIKAIIVFAYGQISALRNQKILVSFGDKPLTSMAVPRLIHVPRALSRLPIQIKRVSKIEFL